MSKVFIIDDDPIHQRIMQIMITKNQIYDEYISFLNAQLALDFLSEYAELPDKLPNVILLDLNMPALDGWGFLDQYEHLQSKLKKDIRIYIVSSSIDEKDILHSKTYPYVQGFISKPISPDTLRNTAKP